MRAETGRWALIVLGIIVMMCLGAIYAYSIIVVHVRRLFEAPPPMGYGLKVTATEMQMPYLVFLAVFGFTMPLMGKYIDKYGPRKMMMLGAVLVGLAWILASFSTNPWMLTILYGVIGGFGVGITYNCPISTVGKWFPD